MIFKKRIPLLKDHHTHPSVYATLKDCLDLNNISNKEKALSLIRERNDQINIILGWNNCSYSFEKKELDSLPPLLICNVSFHGFLMNESAKKMYHNFYRDIVNNIDNNNWTEKNLVNIMNFIVNVKQCTKEQLRFFYNHLLQQGIWYAEEMRLPNKAIFDQFKELGYSERTLFWADMETYRSLDKETQQDIYGIKLFADGAIGAKTAALKQPFLTGEKGILIYSDNELSEIINEITSKNKPLAIHAIGDEATDQVINVLDKIKKHSSKIPPLIRIEHCQFISETTAKKAKSLGIILSMQPNFNYDSVQYNDRLSEEYCMKNNPFRMLIDDVGYKLGDDLNLGSDGMPHGVNFALQLSLFPQYSGQKLTLDEFTSGYCMPDMKKGYIDIEIDEENQSISSKVIIL